jgi:hypothetical protein
MKRMKNHSTTLAGILLLLFSYFSAFAQLTPPRFTNSGSADTNYISFTYTPPPYVPGLKLAMHGFDGTNLFIGLKEADPAGTYDLFFASNLFSSAWNDVAQGASGQTNFSLPPPTVNTGFFRAARTDAPVTDTAGMTAYLLEWHSLELGRNKELQREYG